MMKWMRQHSKQIMVVVVLFAMLAFVGGSALQSLLSPDSTKTPIGEVFGKKVLARDLTGAQRDVTVLEAIGGRWQFGRKDLNIRHWLLLSKEAERAGIEVADEELDEQLRQFKLPEAFLDRLRTSQQRITLPDIRRALRRQLAIEKNAQRTGGAVFPSEAEVRHFVRDTEVKVNVKFVTLDAEKFIDPTEPLAEEELQAQFDAHKNDDPAESLTGIGYRLPRRATVQYILASSSQVEAQIEVSQEEAVTYWKKNKSRYPKMPDPADPSAASPPPSTQPVEKTVSEALPDVEREIRKRRAAQIADQAMRKAASELAKPWEAEKTDPKTLYKTIPAGVEAPDYLRTICERIQKEFGIPLTYAETPLSSKEELTAIGPLRTALVEGEGAEKINLIDYAFRNPVFVPHATGEESGLHLQLFQAPDAPLKGSQKEFGQSRIATTASNLILFRVVEAREAAAPVVLDEVRSRVEHDLRVNRAFQRAEPVAKELLAVASRLGLQDSLELFADFRKDQRLGVVRTPPPFARRESLSPRPDEQNKAKQKIWLDAIQSGKPTLTTPTLQGIGVSQELVDACFELAEPDWQPPAMEPVDSPRTQAATTRPATEVPIVRLLPVPKLKKWFVIQLAGKVVVDEDRFENELRARAYDLVRLEYAIRMQHSWMTPANIEARTGYQQLGEDRPIDVGEGYTPSPTGDGDWPI